MNRKSIQAIIMSMVLAASLPVSLAKAAGGKVTRVGEADRYATAAKVATSNWSNPENLVLVCGEGYADAVSASVLAKQLDAPILLTASKSFNADAKSALDTLKPKNVYVIGGYASVSQSIRNTLKSNNYNVIELSGKNRYETNIAVANELVKLGAKADNVILVSGEGFSDALSVAPIAAAKGEILLLGSNRSSDMKPVLNFVKSNNSKVTVVGTSYAISDDMYSNLGAVDRVNGGANRFETNLNVLKAFQGDLKTDKIFVANASKEGYADALIASSLAGKSASNLVLLDGENDSATSDAISYIKSKISDTTDINVIGGTGVVSDRVIDRITTTTPTPTPSKDSPTVSSISTNGLNQIKVVFNTAVDKDTAELLANYEIDSEKLGSSKTEATANLQDDKRTVLITFSEPFAQLKKVDFKVKNAILDESTANIISEYEQNITFSDTVIPTIASVTPRGGNKLVVRFSEPIRIHKDDLKLLKINRQSIQNFSLNDSQSTLLDKSDEWADGVELYFDSTLPEGSNTITFPSGNAGQNFDSAGMLPLKGTTLAFTIKASEGLPQVKSVSSPNSETLYITYDRPMDKYTALNCTNYTINGKVVSVNLSDISFEEGSNDTVVRIKDLGDLIKKGDNTVVIKDNVSDTYGYAISETKLPLQIADSTIKPQVTSVTLLDNRTIRVKFNKSVNNGAATNKSNYKLVDNSTGEDITYKIDSIGGVSGANGDNKDTYDLRFKDGDDLKSESYTITVKNIYDTNTSTNVMDNYSTTIDGSSQTTKVTGIVKKSGSGSDVVIFFNKAMDESTLTNPANYFFIDGTGDTRKLPNSTVITPGADDKSVTITFSSSFSIGNGSTDRYVKIMGVSNVKDKSGNTLDVVSYSDKISTDYNDGPSLVDNTGSLTYSGNNITVKVTATEALDVLNINDFKVDGKTPDSGTLQDKSIILVFKDSSKISAIRSSGASTTISVSSGNSGDAAGRKLKSGSITLLLPPITDPGSWVAKSANDSVNYSSVTMHFNQEIDRSIETSYYDDFIFTNQRTGDKLNVTGVTIDDNRNIIYEFSRDAIKSGDKIDVRINDNLNNLNIRGKEYGNGNYAVMSPSRDDLDVTTIVAK